MTISRSGTLISGVLVNGCLVVRAENVTIRNSRIVCGKNRPVVALLGSSSGTVISDVELDGTGHATIGLEAKNCVAERLNVHDSGDGVHLGTDSLLEDSYVHDLAQQPELHHDDLQTQKGSTASNIQILHNTLLAYSAGREDNSVYHLGSGSISDILMTDNYLDGGHFSIQVDNGPNQDDIVITGNQFGRDYDDGILDMGRGHAVTFRGNTWQDNGRPATASNSRGHGR